MLVFRSILLCFDFFFSYCLALKICCCHSYTLIHSHSFAANAANIQFLGKFIDLLDVSIGSIILYAPHSLGIHVITLYLLIVIIIGRILSARTSRTFICRNAMSFVCRKDLQAPTIKQNKLNQIFISQTTKIEEKSNMSFEEPPCRFESEEEGE